MLPRWRLSTQRLLNVSNRFYTVWQIASSGVADNGSFGWPRFGGRPQQQLDALPVWATKHGTTVPPDLAEWPEGMNEGGKLDPHSDHE
jgi:hypothetical protein